MSEMDKDLLKLFERLRNPQTNIDSVIRRGVREASDIKLVTGISASVGMMLGAIKDTEDDHNTYNVVVVHLTCAGPDGETGEVKVAFEFEAATKLLALIATQLVPLQQMMGLDGLEGFKQIVIRKARKIVEEREDASKTDVESALLDMVDRLPTNKRDLDGDS